MRRFIRKWKRKTLHDKIVTISLYILWILACYIYITGMLLIFGVIE